MATVYAYFRCQLCQWEARFEQIIGGKDRECPICRRGRLVYITSKREQD